MGESPRGYRLPPLPLRAPFAMAPRAEEGGWRGGIMALSAVRFASRNGTLPVQRNTIAEMRGRRSEGVRNERARAHVQGEGHFCCEQASLKRPQCGCSSNEFWESREKIKKNCAGDPVGSDLKWDICRPLSAGGDPSPPVRKPSRRTAPWTAPSGRTLSRRGPRRVQAPSISMYDSTLDAAPGIYYSPKVRSLCDVEYHKRKSTLGDTRKRGSGKRGWVYREDGTSNVQVNSQLAARRLWSPDRFQTL